MLYEWLLNHQEEESVTQLADDEPDDEFILKGALSRQREHAAALEGFLLLCKFVVEGY